MPWDILPFPNRGRIEEPETFQDISWLYLKPGVSCDIDITHNHDAHHWEISIQLCFHDADNTNSYRRSFVVRWEEASCYTRGATIGTEIYWEMILMLDGERLDVSKVVPWFDEISDWIAYPYRVSEVQSETQELVQSTLEPASQKKLSIAL